MCTLPPPRACVWTVNILAGNFVSPLAVTCSRYLERLVVQSKGALVVTVTIGPTTLLELLTREPNSSGRSP